MEKPENKGKHISAILMRRTLMAVFTVEGKKLRDITKFDIDRKISMVGKVYEAAEKETLE